MAEVEVLCNFCISGFCVYVKVDISERMGEMC